MNMGPMMGPPPGFNAAEKNKAQKPKGIKEVPRYVKTLVTTFFSRLFYIFGLVWETAPWILFVMVFMAIFNGVMPVLGTTITAKILNALVDAFNTLPVGGMALADQFNAMLENQACRAIVFWLVIQLIHAFVNSLVSNLKITAVISTLKHCTVKCSHFNDGICIHDGSVLMIAVVYD